ncbi:MAG: putative sugar O-methyltransferase [Chlamydiales bacterium]
MTRELTSMEEELAKAPAIVRPSKMWEILSTVHEQTLDLEIFKENIAQHYFTFKPDRRNHQYRYVRRNAPLLSQFCALFRKQEHRFTYLIWEYLRTQVPRSWLKLREPQFGSPYNVRWRGGFVTQDLGNALLEVDSVAREAKNFNSVLEIGGGYGRTAYAYLSLFPSLKYICCDITPALYIAQSYLKKIFPHRKIFLFRPFSHYEEIQKEFEAADIAFLLPHQLKMLPDRSVDLGINISSLHEMTRAQIAYYFGEYARLCGRYFYFKEWKEGPNPYDHLIIKKEEYPIPLQWREIYSRSCRIQTKFFESLYETSLCSAMNS